MPDAPLQWGLSAPAPPPMFSPSSSSSSSYVLPFLLLQNSSQFPMKSTWALKYSVLSVFFSPLLPSKLRKGFLICLPITSPHPFRLTSLFSGQLTNFWLSTLAILNSISQLGRCSAAAVKCCISAQRIHSITLTACVSHSPTLLSIFPPAPDFALFTHE